MLDDHHNQPGDYEVGYAKPPKAHQFKPKHTKSKGPRRKKRMSVQAIVEAELMSLLPYNENGKVRKLTKLQLILKRLAHSAMAGDVKAIATSLAVARTHLPQVAEEEGEEVDLTDAERLILGDVLKMKALFEGHTPDE